MLVFFLGANVSILMMVWKFVKDFAVEFEECNCSHVRDDLLQSSYAYFIASIVMAVMGLLEIIITASHACIKPPKSSKQDA